MNSLTTLPTGTATMSSLLIAEITGKNHADVMRDVRSVLEQAEIDESKFAGIYLDAYKREKPCYLLPRRECDLVISGYSVKYRLAIIDRWHALEGQQTLRIPTHIEALRIAADALEQVEEQKQLLAIAAPKVEAYDRLEEADGSLTITDSAKVLQIKPGELFNYLQVATWIYKRPMCSAFVAFQKRLDQGWLTEKTKPVALADGTVRITAQVRITPTGITKLAKIINASRPLAFHSPTTLP